MSILASARAAVADLVYPEGRNRREQLARDADTDPLTGLANRRALDRALPSAERDPHTLVVLFDANNFGAVNKLCGHAEGDRLLVALARRIELAAMRYGYGVRVFRSGNGDEFVVLCSAITACLIRNEAEEDFGEVEVCAGLTVSLTGSVGRTLAEADARLQARKAARKGV
jgi:diguanylate cyclase (GGDEF)-like protein